MRVDEAGVAIADVQPDVRTRFNVALVGVILDAGGGDALEEATVVLEGAAAVAVPAREAIQRPVLSALDAEGLRRWV